MPIDFSALFDSLLVIAGLALVVTGIVMFIRSKSSTDASSVEAFGIKLNVTHPSLILVLAGVGLMLAPRLLPELPGKGITPEPAVVAEAAKPEATAERVPEAAPSSPVVAPTPPPAASQVTSIPAPVSTPTSAQSRVIASATLSPAPVTRVTQAAKPKPKPAGPSTLSPEPTQAAITRPEPVAVTASEAPALRPSIPVKTARPTLTYAALGLPINRGFWSGETRTSYTGRLHTSLQQAGQDILRMNASGLSLSQSAFDAWWNESNQHPRSRELCAAPNAPRALLAARVETPQVMSSIESAYWPELKLRLFICANQRQYRQQKTLSPQNADAWPFATELGGEIERFLRAYRADLTE